MGTWIFGILGLIISYLSSQIPFDVSQENPRFSWWFFSNPFELIWSSNLGYENGLRPWKLHMEPKK